VKEKIKIFVAEDQPTIRKLLRILFTDEDMTVVDEASSFVETKGKIESGDLKDIDIVILDGNLGTGQDDGKKLAEILKEKNSNIKIVPFSFMDVNWGDAKTNKGSDPEIIRRIIRNWFE
jgi:DNA-binding NarL/FixJ family response regulator